jgi:hypothetical protein
MSIEEAVRERHDFEKRLKQFLELAASMTDKELEIALARLADVVTWSKPKSPDEAAFKGMILNLYYRMRISGAKSQSTKARKRLWTRIICLGDFGEHLINLASSYSFPPIPMDYKAQSPNEDFFGQRVKLLAP